MFQLSITSIETLNVPKNPGQSDLNICLTFGPGDLTTEDLSPEELECKVVVHDQKI